MEYFQTIGSLVGNRWKAYNYNEERFPDIASQAISDLPPVEHVSMWDVVRWALTTDQMPHQADLDANFGDPPLTVYRGHKFRIEVLFWAQGTPHIHQHGFSGAFHVLHGSSLHSLWDFDPQERIEARLLIGRVSFQRAELLQKGHSRPIVAGSEMFHATFHLERPSATVVIRTISEADKQPQYTLWPPTIAVAPLDEIATIKRQVQLLRMLLVSGRRAEYYDLARHLLASKDAYSVFRFLMSTLNLLEDEQERATLLSTARARHGAFLDALIPMLDRKEAGDKLLQMHRSVNSKDLKYFLALLRNIPDRSTLLALVEQCYPDREAATLIVEWTRRLSTAGVLGVPFPETWLLMLKHLLMNSPDREIRRALEGRVADSGAFDDAQLADLAAGLRTSWMFQALFDSTDEARSTLEIGAPGVEAA